MNNLYVSISPGNGKMGAIPSVSLPPVITCRPGCPCVRKCYAAKLCRLRPAVRAAYQRNLDLYKLSPIAYWSAVRSVVALNRFFRFHVSGDILNAGYFAEMVRTAEMFPDSYLLAFTKRYEIVNEWINEHGTLPQNMKIIFSAWPGLKMENPHGLPVAAVIFKGKQPDPAWKTCGENCAECACRGVGCWELERGETIAFYEH